MQSTSNPNLLEDEKKYRKLRKVLRQIENLNLLPRCLNEEEKIKALKRDDYRKQLKELNMKYPNNELAFRDNQNTSFELEESHTTNNDNSNLNVSDVDVSTNVVVGQHESFDSNLNELTRKMVSLNIEKQAVKTNELPHDQTNQTVQATKTTTTAQLTHPIQPEIRTDNIETKKTEKQLKKKQQPPVEQPKPAKPIVCFDSYEVKHAHEELIVSLDICSESKFIVTGSRDTSIKVWSYENLKKITLVHSFGGHGGSITLVKFWPLAFYKQCLVNLALQNEEEPTEDEDENELNYPLIVSSSLDCSVRVWNISKGACVKEIYLYNPVNHFQINETAFVVGLGAGKLQYLNNLTQIATVKGFDDSDSVCCVQLLSDNEAKKVYALSQTGLLKVFEILHTDEKETLEFLKESNVYSLLSKKYSLKKNFKSFEILSKDKVLLINDNQSFLILYDLSQETYQFLSTNTTSYGFTSCFFKLDNLLFTSAYNIDDESSNINVFDYEIDSFQYCYTLQNVESKSALSALNCVKLNEKNSYLVVGSSRGQLDIWSTNEMSSELFQKSNKKQVKCLKMCKRYNFHAESGNEEDDEYDESDQQEDDIQEKESDSDQVETKRFCSIQ